MAISSSKESILKKIRKALENPVPMPFPGSENVQNSFPAAEDDLAVIFASEFTKLGGKFSVCTSAQELSGQLAALFSSRGWQHIYCAEPGLQPVVTNILRTVSDDLAHCDAAITGCEFLVARTGSMLLGSNRPMGRTAPVYAPVHICIASIGQLVYDVKDGLLQMQKKFGENWPSFVTLASGPSRTADIEKTLVTGVHGPKEVFCFLIDDSMIKY